MVDKSKSIGDKYGQKGLLQKKVSQTDKFSSVSATINSGKTSKQVVTQSKIVYNQCVGDNKKAKLRNENYYRVTA